MKRIYSLLLGGCFLSMGMLSCESQKPMDPAAMSAKADSIARSRMQMVADSMMNDCNSNKAMWIQMKADSMYNAAVAAMPTTAKK